jgi:tetratricopeptide (TPR) repeat protein
MRLGKRSDGVAHLTEAARLEPRNAEAQFNVGVAQLQLNNPTQAAKCFEAAAKLEPDDTKIQYHLAVALAQQNHPTEAAAAAQKARELALANGQQDLAAKAAELIDQRTNQSARVITQ